MIENTQLAALVASRLCHDMVEPMSAMIQGLEMLKTGDGKVDPDALSLIDHGVNKSWAKLEFFRFAIAGAMTDGDSFLEEGRDVANKLFGELKSNLVWKAPSVAMPRRAVRVIVNLLFIGNDCLPRGGTVEVTAEPHGDGGTVHIVAAGARAMLKPATGAALRGELPDAELSGHSIQPYLTGLFARAAGLELSTHEEPERIELTVRANTFKV
jgi:histidine phosphotransferase ChpT